MENEIRQLVENCAVCNNQYQHSQRPEPSMSHDIPKIPWYKVGCDILEIQGIKYLRLIGYYSKFIEIEELNTNITNQNVINKN